MAMQQPVYAYILEHQGQPPAIFTWPNVLRKYIKDIYTVGGQLALPPEGVLVVKRQKLNPKAGHAVIIDRLNLVTFMAAA